MSDARRLPAEPGLVESLVRHWAAETEICRAHFERAVRPASGEARWLARQAAKELHDGVVPRLERVKAETIRSVSAERIALETRELHEEAAHLAAFAEAHDVAASVAGLPALSELDLQELVAWPANAALGSIRARHRDEYGDTGALAATLTEGGCASLFAVGAQLAGDDIVDRAIASACAAALADEVAHLRTGLDELDERPVSVDLDTLGRLVGEQSIARLHMRQAQLGCPVTPDRFALLVAGAASPTDIAAVERRLAERAPT